MESKRQYVFYTTEGLSLPIAKKLMEEGADVTVAVIQDLSELGNGDVEKPEMRQRRLGLYDGIITKLPAKMVTRVLKSIEDKDNYFIFFDFNSMWKYAEELVAAGFKNGFFPTKEQFTLERDRDKAKEFVAKHYPGLKVGEKMEFKTIEEAESFLEGTDKIWALKGNDDDAKTIVPKTDDVEAAKKQLLGSLHANQKDYESEGFILEEKIINMVEVTPEMIFYNGELICSDVDIETKYQMAGDTSIQVGCGTSLIVRTEPSALINDIAFPPIVYEMAKKHPGMFVWDASVLFDVKTGTPYFGEFCPNRVGWDSFIGELAMSADPEGNHMVSPFFEALVKGENPLRYKFGTTVRLMNEHHDGFGKIKGGDTIDISDEAKPDIWLYEAKLGEVPEEKEEPGEEKEERPIVSADYYSDLGVVTGFSDNSPEEAAYIMYRYVKGVTYDGLAYRYLGDFLATDYPTALMVRYRYLLDHKLI